MKTITAKLGTMKRPVQWTVYPQSGQGTVIIQSNTRIAAFNPTTGKGVLSKNCPNGAYFLHLQPILGATPVVVPPEVIALVVTATPRVGQEFGPGVYVGAIT